MAQLSIFFKEYSILKNNFDYYKSIISDEEINVSQKFCNQSLKEKYILRKGFCRELIASYLCISPMEVKITFNKYGKPIVDNIYFSISHRCEYFVIAINAEVQVGVDLEIKRELGIYNKIIERFASKSEKEYFSHYNSELLFYRWWTGKEAIVKMLGKGLYYSLDKFNVPLCDSVGPDFYLESEFYGKIHFYNYDDFFISIAYSSPYILNVKLFR